MSGKPIIQERKTKLRRQWPLHALILLGFVPRMLAQSGLGEIHEIKVQAHDSGKSPIVFSYRQPKKKPKGVLLVVPGYNGEGRDWLQEGGGWAELAGRERLVILAPSFKITPDEVQSHRGYYYPAQGSGEETLNALRCIHKDTGADIRKVLIFGFSAGAHFAHRFANAYPERVKAFVAYSAGWWDPPSPALRSVPALIMCGEEDERFEATQQYLQAALALHLPFLWRGYPQTSHLVTLPVQRMAEVFLKFYARDGKLENWVGDIQTYEVFPGESEEAKKIPREDCVHLPNREIAAVWKLEN